MVVTNGKLIVKIFFENYFLFQRVLFLCINKGFCKFYKNFCNSFSWWTPKQKIYYVYLKSGFMESKICVEHFIEHKIIQFPNNTIHIQSKKKVF